MPCDGQTLNAEGKDTQGGAKRATKSNSGGAGGTLKKPENSAVAKADKQPCPLSSPRLKDAKARLVAKLEHYVTPVALETGDDGRPVLKWPTEGDANAYLRLQMHEATGMVAGAAQIELMQQLGGVVRSDALNGYWSMLTEINPQTPIEGILANNIAMTQAAYSLSLRRFTTADNLTIAESCAKIATKLGGLQAKQIELLDKLRNGGQQRITVQHQHVTVSDGGQAVVGQIAQGRGGDDQ